MDEKILNFKSDLGIILIHEHVFNLYPKQCKEKSEKFTLEQLEKLKGRNIDYIVDLTPYANINNYSYVIDNSPIKIIFCLGYFTGKHVKKTDMNKSIDELYTGLRRKYIKGVGKQKITPQILKVATNTDAMKEYEKKFIQAAIRLSNEVTVPIAFHCPKNTYNHFKTLLSMGVNPHKLMICHYEKQYNQLEDKEFLNNALEMVSTGCYIQINDFGSSNNQVKTKKIIRLLKGIIENGFIDKILISSDCNWRWKDKRPKLCAGNMDLGYAYLFDYILPLLLKNNITDEELIKILTINTRLFLFETLNSERGN